MAQYQHLPIYKATYDCRITKRNSASALRFEERLERNLMDLYYELLAGQYRPGRSTVFVVEHPKVREVWAADFRDRIVHHLLYNQIADRFHRRFIFDSYACIPNKTSINKIEHGFDALGYVIRPHCRYLRRSTVRNGLNKLAGLCRSDADLESVRQTAHSYFGIFSHANTWKLQGQLAASLHRAGYADAVPHKINNATFPL